LKWACRVGRLLIDNGGNAVVRRDRQELRLELLAFADIDRNDVVLEPCFLEENRHLVTVRRRPVIKIDHDQPACSERVTL